MTDCLFCKLINREIPTQVVYESETIFAFKDIDPRAPHHVVIVPKQHIPALNDLTAKDSALVSDLILSAAKIARDLQIDESGYRLVSNCNADAGQLIFHIHFHLLGGREMGWPPG